MKATGKPTEMNAADIATVEHVRRQRQSNATKTDNDNLELVLKHNMTQVIAIATIERKLALEA